jgi:hypothetical protein
MKPIPSYQPTNTIEDAARMLNGITLKMVLEVPHYSFGQELLKKKTFPKREGTKKMKRGGGGKEEREAPGGCRQRLPQIRPTRHHPHPHMGDQFAGKNEDCEGERKEMTGVYVSRCKR